MPYPIMAWPELADLCPFCAGHGITEPPVSASLPAPTQEGN